MRSAPMQLKSGYGLQVLSVLKFATDRALKSKNIHIRKPDYSLLQSDRLAHLDHVIL